MIPVPANFSAPLLRRMWKIGMGLSAACLLALSVGAVLVRTRQPPAPIPPAASTLSAIRLELPADPEGGRTGQLVARPLFWASRTPPPEETGAPSPAEQPRAPEMLDKTMLLGLFTSGGVSGAILKVAGKSQRLLVGQALGSWTLESISGEEAVFAREDGAGGQRRLTLEHAAVRAPRQQDAHPGEAGLEAGSEQKDNEKKDNEKKDKAGSNE